MRNAPIIRWDLSSPVISVKKSRGNSHETGALLFLAGLVLVSGGVLAAVIPQRSRFDSRMQQVSYYPQNTTIVHAAEGYVSTLVFSEEEDMISTQTGFTKGWNVTKEGNRVYIRVAPVKQPIRTIKSGEDGDEEVESERVFEPQDKDWRTNLFVTTTKHFYSLELRLIDKGQSLSQLAYVIDYRYPQEEQAQTQKTQQARQREWDKAQMKQSIAQAFNATQAPRNWDYYMRVAKDSRDIAPDFAYDDGRFTYLVFPPSKPFPPRLSPMVRKSISLTPVCSRRATIKYWLFIRLIRALCCVQGIRS